MQKNLDWELVERIAGELGVTPHACAKWRQRNSIPHKWRLSIVLKSGGLVRWDHFVKMDRARRGTMQ